MQAEGRGDDDIEASQSQVQRANQDVAYMSAAQIDNLLQVRSFFTFMDWDFSFH